MGCGTARDIEYVIEHLKACETQLYLLDLSPALLEMARARIAAHGLQGQVSTCSFAYTPARHSQESRFRDVA